MHHKKILLVWSFSLLILYSGCSSLPHDPTPSTSVTVPTSTIFHTSTLEPTNTPTLTPTPVVPVQIGTAFPSSQEIVNQENIKQLQEISVLQNGHRLAKFTSDLQYLFIADRSGVTICKMAVDEESRLIIPCEEVLYHYDINIDIDNDPVYSSSDFEITQTGSHFLVVTESIAQVYNRDGILLGKIALPQGDYLIALSPDGKYVSTVFENTVTVYCVEDGEILHSEKGHFSAFSPDGNFFAIQKDMGVFLYNTFDWAITYKFSQDLNASWAFSGDYRLIANVDKGELFFRRLSDGEVEKTIRRYGKGDLILSPNGQYALQVTMTPSSRSEYGAEVKYWDFESGEILNIRDVELISDVKGQWLFEVVHPSQLLVKDDGSVYYIFLEKPWKSESENQKIYETTKGEIILKTDYPSNIYNFPEELCAVTSTNKISCWSGMWTANSFILNSDGDVFHKGIYFGDSELSLYQVEINPRCSEESQFYLAGEKIEINENIPLGRYDVKLINNQYKYMIAKYDDLLLRVVDMETAKVRNAWFADMYYPILSSDNRFMAFLFDPGSNSISYQLGVFDFENRKLKLFRRENGSSSYTFRHNKNVLLSIQNEYGKTGIDKIVECDLETGEFISNPVIEYRYFDFEEIGRLNSLAVSTDNSLIIAGTDKGYLIAFDYKNNSIIHQIKAHENSSILTIEFINDGKMLVTSSKNGEIKIWGVGSFDWNTQ